jgi:hypothetical protein
VDTPFEVEAREAEAGHRGGADSSAELVGMLAAIRTDRFKAKFLEPLYHLRSFVAQVSHGAGDEYSQCSAHRIGQAAVSVPVRGLVPRISDLAVVLLPIRSVVTP